MSTAELFFACNFPTLGVVFVWSAAVNELIRSKWLNSVASDGFIAYDLAQYSTYYSTIYRYVYATDEIDPVKQYFTQHPEELDQRILELLEQHYENEVYFWRNLKEGSFLRVRKMNKSCF